MSERPFLSTERLDLWKPTAADRHATFALVSHPDTARYLGPMRDESDHFQRHLRGAGSWPLYGYGPLIVRLKGAEAIIGMAMVFHNFRGLGEDFDDQPEAGWIIAADHVGKGYAGEAMRAILQWFDNAIGPKRIVCVITKGNAPSIGLAKRLGFATMREAVFDSGEDVLLMERVTE